MPRALLAIALALAAHGATAAEKVVLYGDDDYPPYAYVEAGQFKGIYVDFLKHAATQLAGSYDIELKPLPWKRGLMQLESGDILALFPPYQRRERPYIQPYSQALYTEKVVIMCNDQAMAKPRKAFPADFGDVLIGINAGFQLGDAFVKARQAGQIKVDEAKGNEANLEKLAGNRIGCYVNDRLSVQYTHRKLKAAPLASPDIKKLRLNDVYELSTEDAYVGFSINNHAPYKADFIAKLNAAIDDTRKSGLIDKLVGQYAQ